MPQSGGGFNEILNGVLYSFPVDDNYDEYNVFPHRTDFRTRHPIV